MQVIEADNGVFVLKIDQNDFFQKKNSGRIFVLFFLHEVSFFEY